MAEEEDRILEAHLPVPIRVPAEEEGGTATGRAVMVTGKLSQSPWDPGDPSHPYRTGFTEEARRAWGMEGETK